MELSNVLPQALKLTAHHMLTLQGVERLGEIGGCAI